jgi:hypothetical protein
MGKPPEALHQEKGRPVNNAIQPKVLDRKPFVGLFLFFQAKYKGMTDVEAMCDEDKMMKGRGFGMYRSTSLDDAKPDNAIMMTDFTKAYGFYRGTENWGKLISQAVYWSQECHKREEDSGYRDGRCYFDRFSY